MLIRNSLSSSTFRDAHTLDIATRGVYTSSYINCGNTHWLSYARFPIYAAYDCIGQLDETHTHTFLAI